MPAASREALASVREHPVVTNSGALSVAEVTTEANELYAIADLLVNEPQLRRAMADPASESQARVNLVQMVFGAKVAGPVVELTQAAAKARWSSAWDLVDALELAADEMVIAVAERSGALDDVEDELFRFERILDADGQLSVLLDDGGVSAARRAALLDSLIATKVAPLTKVLLDNAVSSRNKRSMGPAVRALLELAAAHRERSVARVLSAVELTAAQEARLAAALTEIYGRPITVLTALDRGVRGGLLVQVGDEVIDGSIASRLASVRNALAG